MEHGIVKRYSDKKHYGFIARDTGENVFVHHAHILAQPPTLAAGDRVEFDVVQGPKGLEAENVIGTAFAKKRRVTASA
jgi:CspA family cold shock protein